MKTNELAASISPRSPGGRRRIVFGRERIRIKDVVALAHGEAEASIHEGIGGRDRLDSGQRLLPRLIDAGKAPIYGVTTGVGSSIGNAIPPELSDRLGSHLPRMHGCGTGRSSLERRPLPS